MQLEDPDLARLLLRPAARQPAPIGAVSRPAPADVLFVINDLHPGGAQRSLTNLLIGFGGTPRAALCVLEPVLGDAFIDRLTAAGVPVVGCAGLEESARVDAVLDLAQRMKVRTLCFWYVGHDFKMRAAQALRGASLRIVEVSPGPMLPVDLEAIEALQRRLGLGIDGYFRRLDVFVAKYQGGIPEAIRTLPRRTAVIPNGVPEVPAHPPLDSGMLWSGADPDCALVTTCRLEAEKRLDYLVAMMRTLAVRQPRASLTIVGGVRQRHAGYLRAVLQQIHDGRLRCIHFAGPNAESASFLGLFKAFVMISRNQGCPNASLEAMAAGLPVVANDTGGTAEQVRHGVTGFLVGADDPAEMAARVAELLEDPARTRAMGDAGRAHARARFSMAEMVERYRQIL